MTLKPVSHNSENEKVNHLLKEINRLITELNQRDLPDGLYAKIATELQIMRGFSTENEKVLKNELKKGRGRILKILEKEVRLVPKNYYRNQFTAIGITAYGIPMGVAFGAALGNMAFLGVGLPLGLAIGVAIGTQKDKKAAEEGRQLETEISY